MPKRRKKIENYLHPKLIPGAIPEQGGQHPKTYFYAQVAKYGLEAINVLVYLMRESNNPFIRLNAAKTVLNKTIPDLKAVEITGELNQRAMIVVKQYGEGDIIANTVKEVEANKATYNSSEIDNKENTLIQQPNQVMTIVVEETKEEQQLRNAVNKAEL